MGKGGQPTKFPKISLRQVEKLAGYGLIDKEVADILGIGYSTLSLYKVAHPEFLEAIKKGKLKADLEVVKSLYKRAVGYKYDEIHYEQTKAGGLGISISQDEIDHIKHVPACKVKIITKHVVPDVAAQCYWTKNRRPQDWRDKHEFEHTFKEFLFKENEERSNAEIQKESIELAEAIISKRKGIIVSQEA